MHATAWMNLFCKMLPLGVCDIMRNTYLVSALPTPPFLAHSSKTLVISEVVSVFLLLMR